METFDIAAGQGLGAWGDGQAAKTLYADTLTSSQLCLKNIQNNGNNNSTNLKTI